MQIQLLFEKYLHIICIFYINGTEELDLQSKLVICVVLLMLRKGGAHAISAAKMGMLNQQQNFSLTTRTPFASRAVACHASLRHKLMEFLIARQLMPPSTYVYIKLYGVGIM
jgi:hypothetical protein